MGVASMLVPGDFQTTQAAIERKRKLIDSLAARVSDPKGQMISGHYIPPSIFENLASLGGGIVQDRQNKKLDEEAAQANTDYQTGLGDAMNKYLQTREGGQPMPTSMTSVTPDGSPGAPMTDTTAPNPRKAMLEAITSQYKPLQDMGMAEFGQMGKNAMHLKDYLPHIGEGRITMDSAIKAVAAQNPSLLQQDVKPHVVQDQVLERNPDGTYKVAYDAREKFGPLGKLGVGPDGKLILGQTSLATNKNAYAPANTGTTVNVSTEKKAADAFGVAIAGDVAKNLSETRDKALAAQAILPSIRNASLLVKELPGGIAAQPILGAKKIIAALGGDAKDIETAEEVAQVLKQTMLSQIKQLGANPSNSDREFLLNLNGANLSASPQTLQHILKELQVSAMNTVSSHQRNLQRAPLVPGADPRALSMYEVPMPDMGNDSDVRQDPKTGQYIVAGVGVKRQEAKKAQQEALRPLTKEEEARMLYLQQKLRK